MSFGLACAPWLFTQLGDFVVRCINRRGVSRVSNYIDDFTVLGASHQECVDKMITLISVLRRVGFDMKWEKVLGPAQVITCLGIQVDSISLMPL